MIPDKKYGMYTFLVLISLFLSSCLTTGSTQSDTLVKAYQGAERSLSQVAVIECGIGAKVKAVDGNQEYTCNPLFGKLHVLPGQHNFDVWMELYDGSGTWRSKQGRTVRFKATAGHTYMIMALQDKEDDYKQDGWFVTVHDTDTTPKGEGWKVHPNKAFIGKK